MTEPRIHLNRGPAPVLAAALAGERAERQLTVDQAAQLAGLTAERLTVLEQGGELPTRDELAALDRAYQLDDDTGMWLIFKLGEALDECERALQQEGQA